jgi:hypothetical protein
MMKILLKNGGEVLSTSNESTNNPGLLMGGLKCGERLKAGNLGFHPKPG